MFPLLDNNKVLRLPSFLCEERDRTACGRPFRRREKRGNYASSLLRAVYRGVSTSLVRNTERQKSATFLTHEKCETGQEDTRPNHKIYENILMIIKVNV